jgi:hypothetical protein
MTATTFKQCPYCVSEKYDIDVVFCPDCMGMLVMVEDTPALEEDDTPKEPDVVYDAMAIAELEEEAEEGDNGTVNEEAVTVETVKESPAASPVPLKKKHKGWPKGKKRAKRG